MTRPPAASSTAAAPRDPTTAGAATAKPDATPGDADTRAATSTTATPPAQAAQLPLPHENDQRAAGTTAPQPDAVIDQAKKDLDRGLVDTDMRATPGLDAQRRTSMVPPTKPR